MIAITEAREDRAESATEGGMSKAMRLNVLTFMGTFLEVAFCVWGLKHRPAFWLVPILLASYHGGYLMARWNWPGRSGRWLGRTLPLLQAVLAVATCAESWPTVALTLFLLASVLQALRRSLKRQTRVCVWHKNLAKLLGMGAGCAGALASTWLAFLLATIAVGLVAVVGTVEVALRPQPPTARLAVPIDRRLLWFELLHHGHYFSYCYSFWLLLGADLLPWVGPLFAVGWLGYFVLDWLLGEHLPLFDARVLALGHLAVAGSLGGMLWFAPSIGAVLWMWFMTGIGGGTAYMLSNAGQGGDRELFEDAGHVLGCLGGGLAMLTTGEAGASVVLGLLLALVAVAVLGLHRRLIGHDVCSPTRRPAWRKYPSSESGGRQSHTNPRSARTRIPDSDLSGAWRIRLLTFP